MNTIFSKKLIECRENLSLTQKALSELTDIPQSTIARWEVNKNQPKAEEIAKLSKFFEVTSDYLLGIENDFGVIEYKSQPKKTSQEDEEMQQFWNALRIEYKWKLIGRAAAMLEEQQQKYK